MLVVRCYKAIDVFWDLVCGNCDAPVTRSIFWFTIAMGLCKLNGVNRRTDTSVKGKGMPNRYNLHHKNAHIAIYKKNPQ